MNIFWVIKNLEICRLLGTENDVIQNLKHVQFEPFTIHKRNRLGSFWEIAWVQFYENRKKKKTHNENNKILRFKHFRLPVYEWKCILLLAVKSLDTISSLTKFQLILLMLLAIVKKDASILLKSHLDQ